MLVFGIDKFMSECRALTNLMGNSVATIVVSRWEGQFDRDRATRVLNGSENDLAISDRERRRRGRPGPAAGRHRRRLTPPPADTAAG